MAALSPNELTVAVGDGDVTLFDAARDGGPVATYKVKVQSGDDLSVRVEPLHPAGRYDKLSAGEKEYYRVGFNGIVKVIAKSAGSSVVRHGALANLA